MIGDGVASGQARRGFPYWRRGLVVFLLSVVIGPVAGAFGLAVFDAMLSLLSGRGVSFGYFWGNVEAGLGLASWVGFPLAAGVGLVLGWLVARRGMLPYKTTALATLGASCVFGLLVLGPYFFILPVLAVIATVAAVTVQYIAILVARRVFGIVL